MWVHDAVDPERPFKNAGVCLGQAMLCYDMTQGQSDGIVEHDLARDATVRRVAVVTVVDLCRAAPSLQVSAGGRLLGRWWYLHCGRWVPWWMVRRRNRAGEVHAR